MSYEAELAQRYFERGLTNGQALTEAYNEKRAVQMRGYGSFPAAALNDAREFAADVVRHLALIRAERAAAPTPARADAPTAGGVVTP